MYLYYFNLFKIINFVTNYFHCKQITRTTVYSILKAQKALGKSCSQ